jgi:hypothetical protein
MLRKPLRNPMKPDSVLAKLALSMGITANPVAADVSALQAEFEAFKVQAESDLNEVKGALASAVALAQEVEAQRDELAVKLAAVEAASASAAEQAAAAKVKAREDKLIALLGTERAAPVIQATSGLPDEGFEAVVAAMTTAAAVEAKSPMFTEAGVQAEASASVAEGPSLEMQMLRKQHAKSAA